MLRPGDRIDRYVVVGELGEGALATVYLVRHATLGTLHALKVVKIAHQEARDRLIKEGKVQASLNHENIVNVTDVLDVKGTPGTLMEYVRGVDLEQLLMRFFLPLDDALALFRGVVCGVGHAHAKGLVHRDLKPANVLLAVEEGRVVPKVTDFGLVKAVAGEEAIGGTRQGSTMGTPGYMPPEQIRDASSVDRRADMWALGCLLYRMVCHMPAFPQTDMIELFSAVAKGDMLDPREHVADLPDHVVKAIHALIVVDASQRLQSCADLLAILDEEPRTPVIRAELGPVSTPTTAKPTWIAHSTPAGMGAIELRTEAEAALAARQPAFPTGPNETIAPVAHSRWRMAIPAVALLGGLTLIGLGIASGAGRGGGLGPDGATPRPEPRKPKAVDRPKPEPAPTEPKPVPVPAAPATKPEPAPPAPAAPKPAPEPVPAPVPVPVDAPVPEPVATGPSGAKLVCAECDEVEYYWVSDANNVRVDHTALVPGDYKLWVRLPDQDPRDMLLFVVPDTDAAVTIRVRCSTAFGGSCKQLR